jgi:beta-lactamase regulating signal transducer with metallopeptidase domain
MAPLTAWLASESCTDLLLALGHTLWQGALAGGALLVYLRRTPAQAANRRYGAALAALGAVLVGGLLTWSILRYEPRGTYQSLGQDVAVADSIPASVPATPEPAGAREESPAAAPGEPSAASDRRQVWIMEAWLAGVALMLVRLVAAMIGGGRLQRGCRPLEDSRTLDLIRQLRDRMGIGRKIRVLVGDRFVTPGVIGCFWPALLLPASMTSGIAVEDLKAILVHELAHIRRYDYLVNFVQMVVEALLFFNPTVWWISRQIRIEREACCDAAGVQWTGQRHRYAEALVAWAQRLGESPGAAPAPAVGFGRDMGGGNILDRVRRILIAGHQPRPHVPWHVATAMLVLSLACLVVIQQAAGLAVNLAGRILTPQERIDKIAAVSEEYGYENREYGPEDRIEISGVIRTWDAAPLPDRPRVWLYETSRWSSSTTFLPVKKDGTFRTSAMYGRIYLTAAVEGYAPAFAGPLDPKPGARVAGIELLLADGFPARIQTLDETGRPVPEVELTGAYPCAEGGSFPQTVRLMTDATGAATLAHAVARPLTFQINADGFESERTPELTLGPDEIRTITLKRSLPTTGVVLSEMTGRTIAGAEVRIFMSVQGTRSYGHRDLTGAPAAVTDADGRFELSRLQRDHKYLLFIRAPGYAYRYVPDVQPGRNIEVLLGDTKIIRGTITGDLSLLATDAKSGTPILHVENSYRYPESNGYADSSDKSPVTIRDGVGHFEIDDFWGQTVTLRAGPETIRLSVQEDRLDNLAIHLRTPERRQVVLRFATPEGGPPIEGSVRIDYAMPSSRPQMRSMTPEWLDIRDGRASSEIPVPAKFKYSIDFRNGKRPVGYWFNAIQPIDVEPGEDPCVIDVPVFPAGAIYGRIFRPDGRLAEKAHAALIIVQKPDIENGQPLALSGLYDTLSDNVDRGTFNATPLPLGGRYAVAAYEDYAVALSDTFSLDEKSPIINVDLRLPQGTDLEGRLLDVDGTPARHEVSLDISTKREEQSWGLSGVQVQPDETGRFVFRNVNPGPQGTCSVHVIGGTGYRPIKHEVKNLRSPVTIRLEKGLRVTGTVLDDATGWPVPGAEVYAYAVEGPRGQISHDWELLETDGRTDRQGRFVFSNMAARQYSLNIRSANPVDPQQQVVVVGGQNDPVILRIRIPEGSDLRPAVPDR